MIYDLIFETNKTDKNKILQRFPFGSGELSIDSIARHYITLPLKTQKAERRKKKHLVSLLIPAGLFMEAQPQVYSSTKSFDVQFAPLQIWAVFAERAAFVVIALIICQSDVIVIPANIHFVLTLAIS